MKAQWGGADNESGALEISTPEIDAIIADNSTPEWKREALRALIRLDAHGAALMAEVIASLMYHRCNLIKDNPVPAGSNAKRSGRDAVVPGTRL